MTNYWLYVTAAYALVYCTMLVLVLRVKYQLHQLSLHEASVAKDEA